MLLLLREGEVLLEKRHWSDYGAGYGVFRKFPRADPGDYCRRRLAQQLASTKRLPLLRHVSPTFTLNITPVVCQVASASPMRLRAGASLAHLEEAAQAAVPAPVRKLLNSLQAV